MAVMMRFFILALVILCAASTAHAADQPVYAPPGDWVKSVSLPEKPGPDTTTPTRILLEDMQVRFDGDARESYWDSAAKIQSSQGLSAVGNLTINWKPDTDTLTIHKVRIIRGAETIDLLAGGHAFTVLRRENNLEMAMLDGTLTAAIQPEGLQVGDILELSFTVRRSDPVMQGQSEWLTGNTMAVHVDHLNIRGIWPASKHLRWRQTDGLAEPKITSTKDGQELSIAMDDVQPVKPPKNAPVRYFEVGHLEGSEFQSWANISALMEPLYVKASTLAATSPLKAEVAKIKALSSDPKVRAMAALKLVEDQIRYLFLGMNNGGYVPANADQTWSRRFGDCKGKTVVLLALLHELGIEAQPALANITQGDGMDERLPMLEVFDHVLVRAVIDGKTFWLDGTRVGDRTLDDIPIPGFRWVLPVQETGGALVKLIVPQPKTPFVETETHFDASAGLDTPAAMHATMVFRGDAAIFTKYKLASASREDNERTLRDMWKKSYFNIDVKTVDYNFDETTGEERVTMDGTANLSWRSDSTGAARRYEVDGAVLGWKPEFDRDPGHHVDAPFAVAYPLFNKVTETIVLPNGGTGFSVDGTTIDQAVAAWAFKRTAKIDNGVFTMEASTKTLTTEFPAAAAPQAITALRDLSDSAIYVRSRAVSVDMSILPPAAQEILKKAAGSSGAQLDKAMGDLTSALQKDTRSAAKSGPVVASFGQTIISVPEIDRPAVESSLEETGHLIDKGDFDGAIAAYGKFTQAYPNYAHPWALRSMAYMRKGDMGRASQDLESAEKLDPHDGMVFRARGLIADHNEDYRAAVEAYSQSLSIFGANRFDIGQRARDYQMLYEEDKALADYEQLSALKPDLADAYANRVSIFMSLDQGDKALAEADRFVGVNPASNISHQIRGLALKFLKRNSEAEQEFSASLSLKPTVTVYLERAHLHYVDKPDQALADIAEAAKLDPTSPAPYMARANFYEENGDIAKAVVEANNAVNLAPDNAQARSVRANVLIRNNQYNLAIQDTDHVLQKWPGNSNALNSRCWTRATAGKDLELALTDCNASIAKNGSNPMALDSRGFVRFRMGQFDQAISDYDAALKLRPKEAPSLFGKGLAELRKGEASQGNADLMAARAVDPKIDSQFADYGVKP